MAVSHRFRPLVALLLAGSALFTTSAAWSDTVTLKNGATYRGTVDRDNTLIIVSSNLKRTIFYNSKVSKIDSDPGFSQFEGFEIEQPLGVHAGMMPHAAVAVEATPWDDKGRRMFRYINERQQTVTMQQAINKMRPYMVSFRGIDGFWQGQIATNQVPRPVILGLLGRVNQQDQDERLKVARWLIQAEWYPEAILALDGLLRDFPKDPSLRDRVADTRKLILELESRDTLKETALRRKALQPFEVRARLRSIPVADLPKDLLDDVRDQLRKDDDQAVSDRLLAISLRDLAEKLPEGDRKAWKGRIAEVLEVLSQAPDVARIRLEALTKADPSVVPESRFALAMSGWVVGADAAVDNLARAGALWDARRAVENYLSGVEHVVKVAVAVKEPDKGIKPPAAPEKLRKPPEMVREDALASLRKLLSPEEGPVELEIVARIIARMVPPLRDPDPQQEKSGVVTLHRVKEDDNPVPSEYAILLPPEYHPSRSYPAVVALHDGRGPKAATDWLASEAARHGYIVIAPEYQLPNQRPGYHFSPGEHAAVELSLRDARKRYSIDSDRVYLAGQLVGAEMAWDFGLAHPDLFAGIVVISGFPAKYAYRYRSQVDRVPLYIALGELAPAAREVVFDQFAKPMILDVQDVTYVDYLKRGLEELPEEVPSFFDWMDRRRRDPAPKTFEVTTAREGDDHFFGVIVQEFVPGRTIAPEAADMLGKNIRPATIKMRSSVQGNLINLTTTGINRLDVWVSPRLIDFKRKIEVRLNEKPLYKGAVKLEFAPMLEDLRIRGDRQQLYYFKVTTGMAKPKPR